MSRAESQRQILRSTSIIGASTIAAMALGLVRSKVIALHLGPAGVGVIGLFNSFLVTATSLGTLGLGTSGVRQVADVREEGDQTKIADVRRALSLALAALGLVAAAMVWLFRVPLASLLTGDANMATNIGWLGIGVGLGVAATSQNAILNGLRRIGDIARTSLIAAVATTVIGLAVILTWGPSAIVPYVLITPIATFIVGQWFVARLRLGAGSAGHSLAGDLRSCSSLVKLGLASLTTLFLMSGALLVLRALIHGRLGTEALGLFEASWTLLNAYLGAVLLAMGTDFYPRLVAAMKTPEDASALVNEQTRLALMLAGPMCVASIAFAPLILHLLFSSQFVAASTILRVLMIGDIFKLVSWPIGFVLIAAADARRMIAAEVMMVGAMLAIAWFALERIGLVAAGIGYLAMYLLYALVVVHWVRRMIGFRWDGRVLRHAAMVFGCAATTFAASSVSETLAMAVGTVLAGSLGILALREIDSILEGQGKIGRAVALLSAWTRLGVSRG